MAAKGGGAWKVAYADFVTAMMAFFLVMWICAQDQKVKKAVADYFTGPGQVRVGSRAPTRLGGTFDGVTTGDLPNSEKVLMGKGRDAHTNRQEFGRSTKLVSDWLNNDEKASRYWRQQAARQRELAQDAKRDAKANETVEQIAAVQLASQMKDEIAQEMFAQTRGLTRDLLYEALGSVNWLELAEDVLSQ
jgi:flagellar motor protein MotB